MRFCPKCRTFKNVDEFYPSVLKRVGTHCKKCMSSYNKEWIAKHPELSKAYSLKWVGKNRKKAYAANRKWHKKNKGLANAKNARRYAAKTKSTPSWADKIAISGFYLAASRKTRETGIVHHVDHIYPLRSRFVCGLHVENNLRVITASENFRKSVSLPGEQVAEVCPML